MTDETIILFGLILFAITIISFVIIEIITKKIMLNKYIKQTGKLFEKMFKEKEDEMRTRIRNSVLNELKSDIIKIQTRLIELADKK